MARNVAMCGEGTETQRDWDWKHDSVTVNFQISKLIIAEILKYGAGVPSMPMATAVIHRRHLFYNRDGMVVLPTLMRGSASITRQALRPKYGLNQFGVL